MARFWGRLRRLATDRRAVSALEYTLITVIIGAVVLAGVDILRNALTTSYGDIGNAMAAHAAGM